LIWLKACGAGLWQKAAMTNVSPPIPPVADDPHFEVRTVGRLLDDLYPDLKEGLNRGPPAAALAWTLAAVIALAAFIGWLLVSPPLPR
jgi:hypothetical protein